MVQTRRLTSVLLSVCQLLEGPPGPLEPEQKGSKGLNVTEQQVHSRKGYKELDQEEGGSQSACLNGPLTL